MHLDDVIQNEIGGFGPWQQFIAFAVGLAILPSNLFLPTFPTFIPKFRCRLDACDDQSNSDYRASWTKYGLPSSVFEQNIDVSRCVMFQYIGNGTTCAQHDFNNQVLMSCTSSVYDQMVFQDSLVAYLDIGPCSDMEPSWSTGRYISKIALLDLSYWIGIMLGNCVIGRIGDFLGGRKAIILSSVLFSLSSALLGATDTYWGFTMLSFTAGIFALSSHTLAFVYLSEVVGKTYVHFTPAVEVFRIAGSCLYGLVAYSSQNWRVLWWYGAFMNAFLLPIWVILHESPRWLLSRGHYDEFQRVMTVAAKCNGVQLNPGSLDRVVERSRIVNAKIGEDEAKGLYRSPLILKNLGMMYSVWFSTTAIFFGVVRLATVLEGDIYANYFMISISSLIGVGICIIFLKNQSRKRTLLFFLTFGSLSLLVGILVPNRSILLALMIIAKISVSVSMPCCYVLTAELFPGPIRNSAIGSSSAAGRAGALLASWLINSKCMSLRTTIGVLVVLGLSSTTILALFLPDTLSYKLPDSLEDVQRVESESIPFALHRRESAEKSPLMCRTRNLE